MLALASAVAYGAADFLGGLASRTRSATAVAAVSAGVGVVVFTVASGVLPGVVSTPALVWGAVSGIAGMTAAACLYAALAIGPMTLVAPLTATISGMTPVVWSIATGAVPSVPILIGLALVLIGAALVSLTRGERASGPPLVAAGLAVVAGLLFGAFYIFLAQTPADSGMVPLIANRLAGLMLLAVVLFVAWRRRGLSGRVTVAGLLPSLATGLLDATANALYVLAVRGGDLSVVAVIVSLYPAGTIALSAVVLRERVAAIQWIGVVVALAGIIVLAI